MLGTNDLLCLIEVCLPFAEISEAYLSRNCRID